MEYEAMRGARAAVLRDNIGLAGMIQRALNPPKVTFAGRVDQKQIIHTGNLAYINASGGFSLSSSLAEFFEVCGAENGYTQGGQCKSCAKKHSPPNFTSSSHEEHERMLTLLESNGWEWKWERSRKNRKLSLTGRGGNELQISGDISGDMALILATLFLCVPRKHYSTFRELFPR